MLKATILGDLAESHFYPPMLWIDRNPTYNPEGFKEEDFQFDDGGLSGYPAEQLEEFPKLQVIDILDELEDINPKEAEILFLASQGYDIDQIVWLLNTSGHEVERSLHLLENKLGAHHLVQAGLMSEARQVALQGRYARTLARSLHGVVDARVMRVIANETHCGLQLMLANGQQMKLWFCAGDQSEMPGWAALEESGGSILYHDQMVDLGERIRSLVGRRQTTRDTTRQLLQDIAERAIDLIDFLDGDADLEVEEEADPSDNWECEDREDEDEVPTTLNPRHQNKRAVYQPVYNWVGTLTNEQHAIDAPPSEPSLDIPLLTQEEEREVGRKHARLAVIEADINATPEHQRGFVDVFYQHEIQLIVEWLQSRGRLG